MIRDSFCLEDALLLIQFGVRHELGGPASFATDRDSNTRSAEALAYILARYSRHLENAVCHKCRTNGIMQPPSKAEILASAYLYAVQPPIVEDCAASKRKEHLRLEFLLEWLDEMDASEETFEKRFKTWANIFATEYMKLLLRQQTDVPVMEWAPKFGLKYIGDEEEYSNHLANLCNNVAAEVKDKDDDDNGELLQQQEDFLMEFLTTALSSRHEDKRRVAAVFILRLYLSLEMLPGFSPVRRTLLDCCAACTGKTVAELEAWLENECVGLRPRTDLMARRKHGDLPKLDYPFVLSFIGEDASQRGRYYTATCRFTETLNQQRKLLFPSVKTNEEV